MISRFMITTAIDYPNGSPHMGHAYEKILADTYARWARLMGKTTFFLTGTDENGQKLVKAAEDAKMAVLPYVNEQVDKFLDLSVRLSISNDDFIRTTESRHHKVCQDFWKVLAQKGDIYFSEYEGLYCLACESFYTELQAEGGRCPTHGSALQMLKEKGYFFRLSSYADWAKEIILKDSRRICPASVRKEMINRLEKEPIRDLSISRPNEGWGIPVPGDEAHVMYTWFDALINYVTATREGPSAKATETVVGAAVVPEDRRAFWPAQMHVIGKDIVWFHTVIWFSMLKAADLPLPEQVYAHGMVLGEDGRKMSKSLNNGVDPLWVLERFPVDSFRYYLLRAIPSGMDGAFVRKDLQARHNNELANDLGNLLSRVVKLALKKIGADISSRKINGASNESYPHELTSVGLTEALHKAMDEREHHRALERLWVAVKEANEYLNVKEPWKKDITPDHLVTCLVNALFALNTIAVWLSPFMPTVAKEMLRVLGSEQQRPQSLNFAACRFRLLDPQPLFPKIEVADFSS